jgi:hypothetical protein
MRSHGYRRRSYAEGMRSAITPFRHDRERRSVTVALALLFSGAPLLGGGAGQANHLQVTGARLPDPAVLAGPRAQATRPWPGPVFRNDAKAPHVSGAWWWR